MVYRSTKHEDLDSKLDHLLKNSVGQTVIVFFSPSGVQFSIEALRNCCDVKNVKFVALGPSTEKALEENFLEVNGVCQKPNPYSLLQVIKALENK